MEQLKITLTSLKVDEKKVEVGLLYRVNNIIVLVRNITYNNIGRTASIETVILYKYENASPTYKLGQLAYFNNANNFKEFNGELTLSNK